MTETLSTEAPEKKLLMQALKGKFTSQVPFWLMRQAGRYLPEYRELRRKAGSFLDLCFDPDMAAEITLQPINRFDIDAAILFSDILVVPYALGQNLDFVEGEGPRLGAFQTIQSFGEIDFDVFNKKLQPVYETINLVKKNLAPEKTFIGFAGGPWTVACYMVQGRGDEEFINTKKFAFSHPEEFDHLIETLVMATSNYLLEQIKIGVDAVQIFDSWAGLLPELYFDRWVIKPTKKIVNNIHKIYPGFPIIGFPRRAGFLYSQYAERSGVRCVGLDQYLSLGQAIRTFGSKVTLQGNLDPVLLLAGGKALEIETRRILETAGAANFIFNLGHGIIKETPPEHVFQLANILKEYQR